MRHDGARPRPCVIDLPNDKDVVFKRLIRVGGSSTETVDQAVKALGAVVDGVVVPFAIDLFGSLFCMRFERKSAMKIA